MTNERPRAERRGFDGWPKILAAAAVGALVVWMLPRLSRQVVLVDGSHRWAAEVAPPRRAIVWKPAEPLPAAPGDLAAADSLVRPQLAEGGRAVYYTRQQPGGEADIYRSEFDGSRWLPGEPVAGINSDGGDYGPFISADGETLLLYSDREGGFGGYDLYASRRTDDGWDRPRNLGPLVNSPAHEYDPALTADGLRLFFASNRTPRMVERLREAAVAGAEASPWKATLRAEVALEHFDIYVADRERVEGDWRPAANLQAVNLPAADEGEPCVSADGAFLYFASNRPNAHGPAANFDIYRLRLAAAGPAAVENLGGGVNTAANEHDPSLSSDGFRIVFSSDRVGGNPEQYGLYSSLAVETFDERAWSTAHLSPLARNWWWLTLLALLLGLVAAIVWWLRDMSRRRAPVPVFFLISLVMHLLMISGAFLVPIQGVTIAERIRQKIEQIVATDVVLESNPMEASAPRSFEAVAEPLAAVESEAVAAVPRQAAVDPTMSRPMAEPSEVKLSTAFNREPITGRITDGDPVVVQQVEDPSLERRASIVERMLAETTAEIAPAPAAREAPAEAAAPRETVVTERAASDAKIEVATASVQPEQPRPQNTIVAESISAATSRPVDLPTARHTAALPERSVRPDTAATDAARVETLDVPVAVEKPAGQSPPAQAAVDIGRRAAEQRPELPEAVAVETPRLPVKPAADAGGRAADAAPAPPTAVTAAKPSSLPKRERAAGAADAAIEAIATDALAAKPATTKGEAVVSESVQVELSRDAGSVKVDVAARETAPLTAVPAPLLQPAVAPQPIAGAEPPAPGRPAVSASVARRATAPTLDVAGATEIAAASLASPRLAASKTAPAPAPVEVSVARAAASANMRAGGPAALTGGDRGGPPPSGLRLASAGGRVETTTSLPSGQVEASLARRRSMPASMLYAQEQIGLQQMLRKRVVDEASKQELVDAFGGRPETLEAIRRGLHWLAVVQHEDGRWKLQSFPAGPGGEKFTGQGRNSTDAGATGLALLPLLGDGHTPLSGRYQDQVSRGLQWLVKNQKPDGDLTVGPPNQAMMYGHGIATIALCEAFGMTRETWLQEPAQRAIDFIVKAQHAAGGWRYQPGQPGDTSVVGWQVMALKSGQMAGLTVPETTLEKARAFLETCRSGPDKSQFSYTPGAGPGRPGITGEGLLCMQYLGWKRDSAEVRATTDFMLKNLPKLGKFDSYHLYYGTQSLFHVQGQPWEQWNKATSETVLATQIKDGPHAGTWDPNDEWEQQGGRIYSTSLRLLMLEVYFRHLPLYQVIQ
jgi:hypothetical protein